MASRRNYVTAAEVLELAGFTPSDTQISEAEEIIDSYVGYQPKFFESTLSNRATAGGSSSLTLNTLDQNTYEADYFKWCEVEIIGGTGVGQRRTITASTKAGVLTVASAWTTTPDSASFYRIYQLGKFPRYCDIVYDGNTSPFTYYKQIVESVKRATAYQCEYMNAMGDSFFTTDKSEKQSESIGDYSYSKGTALVGGVGGVLVAPKAKQVLRGLMNRGGELVV